MRNARPFIASIPLALVLVGSVLVALRVAPGAFGFHAWPQSSGTAVAAHPIEVQVPAEQPSTATITAAVRSHPPALRAVVSSPSRVPVRVAPRRVRTVRTPAPAPAVTRTPPVKPAPAAHAPAPTSPAPAAAPAPAPQPAVEPPAPAPIHDAAAGAVAAAR